MLLRYEYFSHHSRLKKNTDFCSSKAYIRSSVLSLAAISVFLRLGLVLKFCLLATVTASHVFVYVVLCAAQFKQHYLSLEQGWVDFIFLGYVYELSRVCDRRLPDLPFEVQIVACLSLVASLLHVLDRQIEFTSRADFLWTAKLKVVTLKFDQWFCRFFYFCCIIWYNLWSVMYTLQNWYKSCFNYFVMLYSYGFKLVQYVGPWWLIAHVNLSISLESEIYYS